LPAFLGRKWRDLTGRRRPFVFFTSLFIVIQTLGDIFGCRVVPGFCNWVSIRFLDLVTPDMYREIGGLERLLEVDIGSPPSLLARTNALLLRMVPC
jgi:hypothetical protein